MVANASWHKEMLVELKLAAGHVTDSPSNIEGRKC